MYKKLAVGVIGVALFTGCVIKNPNRGGDKTLTSQSKPGCTIDNRHYKSCTLKIEASGVGVPPCSGACSTAQAKVMARRAAVLDAYKALAEKLYGIKINGRDTVKNMILQNSNLRAYVSGLIRGAQIEDEEFKDGVYKVTMSLKINVKKWNKYLLRHY